MHSNIMPYYLQETEYAIEVELSDESQYTMYRSLKDIANFQVRIDDHSRYSYNNEYL